MNRLNHGFHGTLCRTLLGIAVLGALLLSAPAVAATDVTLTDVTACAPPTTVVVDVRVDTDGADFLSLDGRVLFDDSNLSFLGAFLTDLTQADYSLFVNDLTPGVVELGMFFSPGAPGIDPVVPPPTEAVISLTFQVIGPSGVYAVSWGTGPGETELNEDPPDTFTDGSVDTTVPSDVAISLLVPATGAPGTTEPVPIFADPADDLDAFDLTLIHDPAVITFNNVDLTGLVTDGWFVTTNVPFPGELRISLFSQPPGAPAIPAATGLAQIATVNFDVVGALGAVTPLSLTRAETDDGVSVCATGGLFEICADDDGDGVTVCDITPDCDDNDAANYPGNTEVCDGQDNDCDGLDDFGNDGVDDWETDNDGDGQSECQGDCLDTDDTVYDGAPEICDGQDNQCPQDNGNPAAVDEGFDADGDTVADCFDNCPALSNTTQDDGDGDNIGDVCDGCPLDPGDLLGSTPWDQGFEADTAGWLDQDDGWSGELIQLASGTGGVLSSSGSSHASATQNDVNQVPGDFTGPFTRFDGYRAYWPGTWTARIDVWLDTSWAPGEGFDYSVAANGTDNLHERDFIFHVTQDTSTGQLLVGGSNNTNFDPREDLEAGNHFIVASTGWYTLRHVFRDNGGVLAVDLQLLDSGGTVLFTETRSAPADLIPGVVGGNRYAWFTNIDVTGGILVDNHQLILGSGDADDDGVCDSDDICPGGDDNVDVDGDLVPAFCDCDDADANNYPGNTEICDGQDNDCSAGGAVTGLGLGDWFSDDTRADGTGSIAPAGTNLISDTLTDDPEGSASGTPAHDGDINQQIVFLSSVPGTVPVGTHEGGVNLNIAAGAGGGKSQISDRKDDGVGHAAGSELGPGMSLVYSWMGNGTVPVTASFKLGIKTADFGSTGVSSRTGENAWDKVLIYEPGNLNGGTSDGLWHTETVDYTTGKWWFFDRTVGGSTIGTPLTLSNMSTETTPFSGSKTPQDVYNLITAPGAHITSVQVGIGSGNAGGNVYVNQLQASFYQNNKVVTFGGAAPLPAAADFPGETIDDDGDGSLSCNDCDDNDVNNFPGNPEVCDGQDNDCNGLADFGGELVDGDNDGSLSCNDCDDADPANFPGNAEVCDGQDNDCNAGADFPGELIDADNDTSLSCNDCDDADPNNFPGNTEVCDGEDNDCLGETFVGGLGAFGWFSDDTRADGTGTILPAGTNLISDTLTDDPEAAASGTSAHDADINQQIQFLSSLPGTIPVGTHPGGVRLNIGPSGSGKSQISHRKDDGTGHAPGSVLSPGMSLEYSWMGDGTTTVTASFKLGIKTADFGSLGTSGRTGENVWDKVLIYEPGNQNPDPNNQSGPGQTWYTETVDFTTGRWWFFDRAVGASTIATPLSLSDMSTNTTAFSGSKTPADVYALITAPGAHITSVQLGIGSGNAGGNVYVNQFQASFYLGGQVVTFGGSPSLPPSPNFPGELIDDDGDGSLSCNDCDDNDINNFPGNPEACDGQDNDCNGLDDAGTPGVGGAEGDGDGDGSLTCADCDDADADVYPGAPEICDDQDNQCPGDAGFGDTDEGFDIDGDAIADCVDNCPDDPNFDQLDSDADSAGDVCDDCPFDPGGLSGSQPWLQGFESDTSGWFDQNSGWNGLLTRVPSSTGGIVSSDGSFHATALGGGGTGPFSRFDGYRAYWPSSWVARLDVYLDIAAWAPGEGFDYSVASNSSTGNHLRDFIFHLTQDTSTGQLLVGGSNNSNGAPREDLDTLNHYVVTTTGWYTLQHVFRDGGGVLAVDLQLLDAGGTVLFTETRSTPADTLPGVVGGNRYAWFTHITVAAGLVIDEHSLDLGTGDEDEDGVCDTDDICPGGDDNVDGDTDGVPEFCDCDDADDANFPGNPEICDGQDNDCNGLADFDVPGEIDGDSDTSLSCADCDDADPLNFPGNPEVCDGQDNNCDTAVDEEPAASNDCDFLDGNTCQNNVCNAGTCEFAPSSSCGITGTVYYNDLPDAPDLGKPVRDAQLLLTGDTTDTDLSASSGVYVFPNDDGGAAPIGVAGDVSIDARKSEDANDLLSLSGQDAARIAQSSVSLGPPLSARQIVAADVSDNGNVTSFDASLVSQKVVNPGFVFPVSTNNGSDWAFFEVPQEFTPISGDTSGVDFVGVFYGDVTLTWQPPAKSAVQGGEASGAAKGQAVVADLTPRTRAATLYLVGPPRRLDDGRIEYVLGLADADGILAVDLRLGYGAGTVRFLSAETRGLGSGLQIVSNDPGEGNAGIALYGTEPLVGTGEFLSITTEFGRSSGTFPFSIQVEANEGLVPVVLGPEFRRGGGTTESEDQEGDGVVDIERNAIRQPGT